MLQIYRKIHFNPPKYKLGYILSVPTQVTSFLASDLSSPQFRQNYAIFVTQTLKKQNFVDFISKSTISSLIFLALQTQIVIPLLSFLAANSDILGEILAFSGGFQVCQQWKSRDCIELATNMLASSESSFKALPDNFLSQINSTKISLMCIQNELFIPQSIQYIEIWRDSYALTAMRICCQKQWKIQLPTHGELLQIGSSEAFSLILCSPAPTESVDLSQKFVSSTSNSQIQILACCAKFSLFTLNPEITLNLALNDPILGVHALEILIKNPQKSYISKLNTMYLNCGEKCLDLVIELLVCEIAQKDQVLCIIERMVRDGIDGSFEVLEALSEM
ncbi:hypothetical protein SS50377_24455 [Spironucleus salmonicida]|uniref:Uncharacterized protein n=1 Tax=Spironucleus salmonicida TaxID=348837 RepID=V6LMT4_9EUKA|nr:hypothetical protein SS50377_24455 [Spironucleus salmonicida]|eukprot:EST45997.1 Hypothetical protein SS50377_13980 [Spironucleus salmonicida]